MRVTSEMFHALSSHPGGNGFTARQLAVFGIEYPLPNNWLKQLLSEEISESAWEKFVKVSAMERARMDAKRAGKPSPKISDKQPELFPLCL